jgi:hypothetical protein
MLLLSLGTSFLLTLAQASAPLAAPAAAASASQAVPVAKGVDLSTPTDPKERLELGQKVNGLRGLDPLPWHLKASYEVFDADGKPKDKGTFEEWRVSAKQYKLAFHSAELSLEEYGTDHGIFRSGGQDWPSSPVGGVQQEIVQPIPFQVGVAKGGFENTQRALGTLKLPCTAVLYGNPKEVLENAAAYCFAPMNGVLLYSSGTKKEFQTLFEHISTVHGQYVAREIQEFLIGRPLAFYTRRDGGVVGPGPVTGLNCSRECVASEPARGRIWGFESGVPHQDGHSGVSGNSKGTTRGWRGHS